MPPEHKSKTGGVWHDACTAWLAGGEGSVGIPPLG